MFRNMAAATIVYGTIAWVVFVGVVWVVFRFGEFLMPTAVSLALAAAGVAMAKDVRASGGDRVMAFAAALPMFIAAAYIVRGM